MSIARLNALVATVVYYVVERESVEDIGRKRKPTHTGESWIMQLIQ